MRALAVIDRLSGPAASHDRRTSVQTLAAWMLVAMAACGGDTPAPDQASPSELSKPTAKESTGTVKAPEEKVFVERRRKMVQKDIASSGPWGREAVTDKKVLRAMGAAPRQRFVPESLISKAYDDRPLPIGHGQTISQPYIVAYMTEMLDLKEGDRVLEIGTGSGYQAAILGEIAKEVYTIEVIEPLAKTAKKRLQELGYTKVTAKVGDGYNGWPEKGPFDAIIVTAAASHIPPPLMEQLKPSGRMAIPVGPPMQVQSLLLVEKQKNGTVMKSSVMPVRFVPFTRKK